MFGHAWYQDCEGIFRINRFQDCQNALSRIKNGFIFDPEKVEQFASKVVKVSLKNALFGKHVTKEILERADTKYEMERFGKAMYNVYEQHYSTATYNLKTESKK